MADKLAKFKVDIKDVMVYFEDDSEPVSLFEVLAVIVQRIEDLENQVSD